jgi:hypothetical protein
VLALALSPARAENLDAGKSPQALFTSTCQACHASPRGLGKGMSASGIASFLREHYTASPQSAAAIAAYVAGAGPDPRAKEQPKGREAKQPEPAGTAGRQNAAESAKGKQTTARRPELDERLPQAHGVREPQSEEPKRKDRAKKQDARPQEHKETAVAPAAAPTPEPEPAALPPSAAPPPAEPSAVAKAPVETPDQPAFSVPSP